MTWTREMAIELAREEYERGRAEMAEQIAQAIERDGFDPGKYTLTHPHGNTLRVMELVRDDCARIARAQVPPKPTDDDPEPSGLMAG